MSARTSGRPGVHADGYSWAQGLISNAGARTLLDPSGNQVAHVYRTRDALYRAILASGEVLAEGFPTSGGALAAVDNEVRPCAAQHVEAGRVRVPCDEDRAPGSTFCAAHELAEVAV